MTISTEGNRKEYTGDGATVLFSFPYKFFANTDLKVYIDGAIQTLYLLDHPSLLFFQKFGILDPDLPQSLQERCPKSIQPSRLINLFGPLSKRFLAATNRQVAGQGEPRKPRQPEDRGCEARYQRRATRPPTHPA